MQIQHENDCTIAIIFEQQTTVWKLAFLFIEIPGQIVLDGDPAPPPSKGQGTAPPQFSAHISCSQMAGRMDQDATW